MIRAFAFDLDGTLVETEKLKALSYARAATELRRDQNEGELLSLVGLYALAVGVALIVLALRLLGLRRGRGPQGVLNPRGGNE